MARRNRVDIFFILYLTAIAAFVVVSRERDIRDDMLVAQNESIVRTFLPPAPVRFDADTLRWYVDADSLGNIRSGQPPFRTWLFISDIDSEDKVDVSLHAVIHDSVLISPRFVEVGNREGVGELEDQIVRFPVTANFKTTGQYTFTFRADTRRIHPDQEGQLSYRGLRIDTTLVPVELVRHMETSTASVTVLVIDTSVSQVRAVETVQLDLGSTSITSATGFEERNTVTCNLGWSNPTVQIVRGGGKLTRLRSSDVSIEYLWTGIVGEQPDSIVIEARLQRNAGGKDIVRKAFTLKGEQPFLRTALPRILYAGESLNLNIAVRGLADNSAYSWVLSEVVGRNEALEKMSSTGTEIVYRIPNSFSGKILRLDARYKGRKYMALTPFGYRQLSSTFSFPVVMPPTRITVDFPARARATEALYFSASQYQNPQFAGDQPVSRFEDVDVIITKENGEVLRPVVTMPSKGRFRILLASEGQINEGGERVKLRIRAREAELIHSIFLERE